MSTASKITSSGFTNLPKLFCFLSCNSSVFNAILWTGRTRQSDPAPVIHALCCFNPEAPMITGGEHGVKYPDKFGFCTYPQDHFRMEMFPE